MRQKFFSDKLKLREFTARSIVVKLLKGSFRKKKSDRENLNKYKIQVVKMMTYNYS